MVKKDFYWGASTSAFQVEGGFGEGGKGIATTDVRHVPEGIADSKVASDQYHHLLEDVELMDELGINLYRFSFNWTRIMGDGYQVNQEGIEFYNQLIDACLEKGITPFPTLYHFEMPQAFVEDFGGWRSRKCIDLFVKYAEVCFENFGDRVKLWGTINEQLIATAASDLNGNHESDPNKKMKQMYQMSYHMSLAEKKAIARFREIVKNGKIGPVCSMQVVYPETPAPADILASKNAEDFLQNCFLDMSVLGRYPKSYQHYLTKKGWFPETKPDDDEILRQNKPDLIGINYYASTCIRSLKPKEDTSKLPPFYRNELFTLGTNTYLEKTKWMEFGIDPEGLYIGMRDVYERYGLPMIVTENGLAYSDVLEDGKIHDDYRIDYLENHIAQCERFIEEGYPLLGYSPWSLLDLVSSHQGFKKRYGLIYVDRTDTDLKECSRIPKDSFYWYKKRIFNQ
ncbi:glycoside hydrolase family 1 protein [Enterococcus gallinarum]|uniref:Beta-glucosidase/6-phospho-beta- glucosidase /beta-galactosid ase n=3 Tax=Enterococcus gallinarum TaxID=1353 RepID=A0A376GY95_ENTGA|nr:glycoside hydrolase family 1 protein [Enterococcus gallinarum]MCD5186845.1 glycoside hydrolase family 1 protein [Enterococcus gallinarum]MDT2688161.1 glycoside hydrolase family 1 protein [Enterococcus gallinarum]MDT2692151.1 glycoside hydrolase family 1 protein [Enterococcus gallinarum]MDT2698571.1 glycoside hydrolase family 1 protein [Enterococcus gallinarum]MDT2730585.1 glycoside hydrolase family 1 protein [Enterococcus gallinarum]